MRYFNKLLSILVIVVGAALGIWFYLENMDPVIVHFFGHEVGGFQLALWLLVFFVAGVLVGLMVSAVQALRYQVHLQLLRKQLKAARQKSSGKAA